MNTADLQDYIQEKIITGGRQTTANNVRQVFQQILESYVNIEDCGFLFQAETGYSSVIALTDPKSFVHKDYVDNAILSNVTASNGLTDVGNDIRLGGALTTNTDITGFYNLGLGTGPSPLNNLNVNAVQMNWTLGNGILALLNGDLDLTTDGGGYSTPYIYFTPTNKHWEIGSDIAQIYVNNGSALFTASTILTLASATQVVLNAPIYQFASLTASRIPWINGSTEMYSSSIASDGNSMFFTPNYGIDVQATGAPDVLNIGTANADIINIGYSGSTINMTGTLAYQNVTNLQVTDKLITLNKGGGAASAVSTGFEIEENSIITGWFATNGTRTGFDFQAPAASNYLTLELASITGTRTLTAPDLSGIIATTNGGQTFTNATWNGNVISPVYGGTGVANNAANTITFTGNFDLGLTLSASTSVTLPTSGTLYGTQAGSFTSTQFRTSLTDPTGTGSAVFATSPTLDTLVTVNGSINVVAGNAATGILITADQTATQLPFIVDGGAAANGDIKSQGVNNSRFILKNNTTAIQWYLSNNVLASVDSFSIGTSSNPVSGFTVWQTTGTQTHTGNVQTSGSTATYSWTKPNNTGQTASTEINGWLYTAGTRQWATGALTTQREFYVTAPTYNFVGASTVTNAYSVYVDSPVAGTNATLTNVFALGLGAGVDITLGTSSIKLINLATTTTNAALYMGQTSPSTTNYSIRGNANQTFFNSPVSSLILSIATAIKLTLETYKLTWSGAAYSGSGVGNLFDVVPAAGSSLAAGTAISTFVVNGSTKTYLAGAITTHSSNQILTDTIAFASASTVTTAYTLYVEAPTAGTNATITTAFGIGTNGRMQASSFRPTGYTASLITDHVGTGILGTQGFSGNGDLQLASNSATRGITFYINGTAGTVIHTMGSAATSGAINQFAWSGANTTGQTASTEIQGFLLNSYSRQWATGAITTQREFHVKTVTYASVAASTITNAYAAYFAAPTAGTNITITNNWALGTSGNVLVDGLIKATSSIKSSSSSAGIGYTTGAGSTVTQITSKTTGVTINAVVGQITTDSENMVAGSQKIFTVTNSAVASTDAVMVVHSSGGTNGAYEVQATNITNGTFDIAIENRTVGLLAEAIVLTFVIIKGVTS